MVRRLVLAGLGALLAATLVAGASLPAGAGSAQADQPLYGIVGPQTGEARSQLVRLDARTLAPVPGRRVPLGPSDVPQGRSPDGALLALLDHRVPKLRIVDLAGMRALGDVTLAPSERWRIRATGWLTADRLVALVQTSRGSYGNIVGTRQLVLVDPVARRVLARYPFPDKAALLASAEAGDKLVLLLGRADHQGRSARLGVVGSDGRYRAVGVVDRGAAGGKRNSVLAADPMGTRALVVTPGAPIAQLDLATLQLTSHEVTGGGSFLRPRGSSYRRALWIDERTLAVSGYDSVAANGRERQTGSGLALVDTERWTARAVDPTAGEIALGRDTLLVFGWLDETSTYRGRPGRSTGQQTIRGRGVTAYGLDGARRWHAFGSETASAQPVRAVARVVLTDRGLGAWRQAVVDLASGRTLSGPAAPPRGVNVFVLPDPPARTAERAPAAVDASRRTEGPPVSADGDGLSLRGTARTDVARVVVVRADGTEQELPLDAVGAFVYEAASAEHAARTLRAESAGRGVLSTVRFAEPRCGGAAGPCPAVTAAPAGAKSFALVPRGSGTALVEVDPRTLRPIPDRTLALPGERYLSARSPDGRLVALPALRSARLDLVDLDRLRPVATLELSRGERTQIRHVAWVSGDRLFAVVQRMRSQNPGRVALRELVVVDTSAARVVARRPLTNTLAVGGAAAGGGRLVLLLRSSDHKGSTVRLAVADARGTVRTTELEVGRSRGVLRATALTVEPDGSRVHVFTSGLVPTAPSVLTVDLDSLRSTRHSLRLASAAGLKPAQVVVIPGAASQAGSGHVAVTDLFPLRAGGEVRAAAGVFLVDTRSFTARLVDADARSFAVAGERLYTFGRANSRGAERGTGVTAYDLEGRRLYHLYGDRSFDRLVVTGGFGHALPAGRQRARTVFDADLGRGVDSLPPLAPGFQLVPDPPARQPEREPAGVGDPFSRVSTAGTPVTPTAASRRALARLGIADAGGLSLLAERNGRALYRLGTNRRGVVCYGAGRGGADGVFEIAACPRGFPSRAQPVLDLTSIRLSPNGDVHRLLQEGIAADAVTRIELVSRSGHRLARIPVKDNAYVVASPPPGAVTLVARTAEGEAVFHRVLAPSRRRPTVGGVSAYGVRLTYPADWHSAVYRPRAGAGSGPLLMVANIGLPPFQRVEDTSAASRRLGPRGVLIALNEAGAGDRASFPATRLPIRIGQDELRAGPEGADALRSFSVEDRLLQVLVHFGSRTPDAATLRAANRVLASLRVARLPRPVGAPVQHGEADGVAVDVYRNGLVFFRFTSTDSRAYRLLAGRELSGGCMRFRTVRGWMPNEHFVSKPFARELVVTLGPRMRAPGPPFEACSVTSGHGRRWNDVRGNHAAVEIPFTERARLFYEERAVARDLALFVRTPVLDEIRRAMRQGRRAPPAAAVAGRFATRVVALRRRGERPPPGSVGLWSNGGAVLEASELTPRGRRLYVTLREGRIGGHNVQGLAFVF